MDISEYLRRIAYQGPRAPTHETLRALHLQHLEAIPFENLDVQSRRPIVLDEDAFFDKIVRRRRGGFCYELNGLFAALLRALGYPVTLLSGRVSSNGNWPTCPEFDHLLLEVTLDRPWLVDVGFGDCFAEPLPLAPGQWASGGKQYRLDEHGKDWSLLEQEPAGGWKILYAFTRVPRQLAEFSEMCEYHQSSPESFFRRQLICSRKTPTGRVTLSKDRLIVTEPSGRREQTLTSEELDRTLLEHFGIARGA